MECEPSNPFSKEERGTRGKGLFVGGGGLDYSDGRRRRRVRLINSDTFSPLIKREK